MFEVLDRQSASDRQPEEDPRRRDHRRCARILRLLPDRLRARLPDRPVEAHLRPVGHRADELGHRRHPRRLCLGLDRRPHRPPQGVHRHGAELLDRHRPALLHAGQRLDLPHDHALLRRLRRRRPLLRRPAAGAGIHADLQARLDRRAGDLRHPDRRRPRRGAGAPSCRPTSGGCCSPSACCRRWSCCWCASGCRNRRAGSCRQGRVEEARKSLAWALQVDPKTLPLPTAGRGQGGEDQLVRPLQVSAQPAGVVARQCRRPDRRLRRRAVGAVAVRAAPARDAAGSLQDDDPAHRGGLHRPRSASRGCRSASDGATAAACWASAPAS